MSKLTIWNTLKHKGFSDEAAAAILGNMEAESNCVSTRVQGDFTDEYADSAFYTRMVDEGKVSRSAFIHSGPGGGGYGLLQWTYPTRKAGLYDLAQSQGASVGDETIQLEWFMKELWQEEYSSVRETLLNSPSIRSCSDALVKIFLRPADQSEAALKKREDLSRRAYWMFSTDVPRDPDFKPKDPDSKPKEGQGERTITEKELRFYCKAVFMVQMIRELVQMMEGSEDE